MGEEELAFVPLCVFLSLDPVEARTQHDRISLNQNHTFIHSLTRTHIHTERKERERKHNHTYIVGITN